jgi:hypothetical protein
VPAVEGASFNVLNEIFMKTVPRDIDFTAAMAARSQLNRLKKSKNTEEEDDDQQDTWGSPNPKIAGKHTEPSTIGSSATTPH